MKISYLASIGLLLWAFEVNAKEYNYELAEDDSSFTATAKDTPTKALYISPRAWGKTDHEGRFLWGDKGADTDWSKEGPVLITPGQQLNYDFSGDWCHGAIMAVEADKVPQIFKDQLKHRLPAVRQAGRAAIRAYMKELPIYKSDQAKYDRIRDATMKAAIASSAATAGVAGGAVFTGILIADGFRKNLCGDWHFLIMKNDKNEYVVFARTR